MFTNVLVVVLGMIGMVGAFFATGIRGGILSHGPHKPISKTGRVILFVGGLLVFAIGLRGLI